MNAACHYAIVRFLPFVETGEFANVGVVLFSPTARYFGFRIIRNRFARITQFFEEIDAAVFRNGMAGAQDELQRVSDMLKRMGTDKRLKGLDTHNSVRLWRELLKPRETMVRFSEPRLVLAQDPDAKLRELFGYYVERSFVTHEHREALLERSVRSWLREEHLLEKFHSQRVGNEEYSAQFPFVQTVCDIPVKAIKPLRLDHSSPTRIIDHGGQWRVRVEELKKRGLLPKDVLFAVSGGEIGESLAQRARRDVIDQMVDLGIQVRPAEDRQAVLEFARQ